MNTERYKFVHSYALKGAITAAVTTRNGDYPVYAKNLSVITKKQMVKYWGEMIQKYAEHYKHAKRDVSFFVSDIRQLKEEIKAVDDYKKCFFDDDIRVAQCQKSLSVYLKWLWCLGELEFEPPVCPIDRYVLAECRRLTGSKDEKRLIDSVNANGGWGALNDFEVYEQLIKVVINVASDKGKTVAAWELETFNNLVLTQSDEAPVLNGNHKA